MMAITDKMVLPSDVELAPVADLDASSRAGLEFDERDWFISRKSSRSRSSIISSDLAEILQYFRAGNTIVDVIVTYSRAHDLNSDTVLDEVWPAIRRFVHANWLVPQHSYLADKPSPWYEVGSSLDGLTIEACVGLVDDTQVYRARAASGATYAIKAIDETSPENLAALEAEARVLDRLDGTPSPRLIEMRAHGHRRLLVMEWCDGLEITQAARTSQHTHSTRHTIRELLTAVLTAYSSLHARGVIHGDVHPGNLLVDDQGNIRILDFGLAPTIDEPISVTRRGGAPEYFDPDYAHASLAGKPPPQASAESEQYSLAALCYRLATGREYLDFPPEWDRLCADIATADPLSFAEAQTTPWPELEQILRRALSKDEATRFPSVAEMASAVAALNVEPPHSRHAPNLAPARHSELVQHVDRRIDPANALFSVGPTPGPRATFVAGAAGIAYYLLRSAAITANAKALAAADQWAERAHAFSSNPQGIYDETAGITLNVVADISPYHTQSGIELVRGLVAHARGDTASLINATRAFLQLVDRPHTNVDPTLGITSVLFASTHLARSLRTAADTQDRQNALAQLTSHGNAVLQRVVRAIAEPEPIGKVAAVAYTGAAHGWAGILYAALMWCELTDAQIPDVVARRVAELAALAVNNGRGRRWPMRTDDTPAEFMNSWCHGAPGQVYLWNAAHRILGDKTYNDIAVAAAYQTHDETTPNPTVCCGQAGHVFALLNMYRNSNDEQWLRYATEHLQSAITASETMSWDPSKDSLYRGAVGIALAATELECPGDARHPLFEL
jgi:serine/threonine protein kinase